RLGEILLARGWVSETDLYRALARQWRAAVVDPLTEPPDPRLIDRLGAAFWLGEAALPWRRIGGATVIATARPESFGRLTAALPADLGPFVMALATPAAIQQVLMTMRAT